MATHRTARLVTAILAAGMTIPTVTAATARPAAHVSPAHVIVTLSAAPALAHARGLTSPRAASRSTAREAARARADEVHAQHARFLHAVTAAGIRATVTARLSQSVNAVALAVPTGQVAALRTLQGVTGVYPDAAMHAVIDPDVSITNAPQVWQSDDPSGRPDEGTGETVAVVDTGIDYNHPDLGGGIGPGHKVVGGYDFVNGDADPMDDNGHGTHVAGIIAGDPAGVDGRTGEAPKAQLTAYKVLGATGTSSESTVLQGLDAAVSVDNPHRADVVNLSLSGPPTPNDPLELACEQAIADGVVVVAAAGNSGPGESTVGSPAEAPGVLAVGASFTDVDLPTVTVTAPVHHTLSVQRLGLSANPPAGGEDLDVIDVGGGMPENYDGLDVAGKAVLAGYNAWRLPQVLDTAQQHGAAAVLFAAPNYYSFTGGQPGPVLPEVVAGLGDNPDKLDLVSVLLSGADGTDLQQWLADGPVRVHLGATSATDLVAAFSAHGPAFGSYAIKPDLVAPGVEIGSTWPGGGYRNDSGTSMAAPHVAGAAALLREAHPDWTAAEVAAALTGGAHPLSGYDVSTVGAGRLDVAAADRAPVLASPRVADLGLADLSGPQLNQSGTVTLTDVSAHAVQVHLTAVPDGGSPGRVEISPHAARIGANGQLTVRISVRGAAPARSADVSGRVSVTLPGGDALTVPYLLAVRPLELHVAPDPASGPTTVYLHSEAALAGTPTVLLTPQHGRTVPLTAQFDHTGWWRAAVPAQQTGTYRVTASARSALGPQLSGASAFETEHSSGADWTSVGPDSAGAYEMASTSRPGRLYALPSTPEHAGIFRTDDGGATWHELRDLPVADGTDMGLAVDPTDPDTVYLAVQGGRGVDPTYRGRILVSHDAGATWTTLAFPDVEMHDLSIDATGKILTAPAFNGNVYVSTDRGRSWTAYPSPNGFPQQARVIGHDLWIAAGDGLFVIRDADSDPAPAQRVFTAPVWYLGVMDVAAVGHRLVIHTPTQVFTSADDGATWRPTYTAPTDDPFINSMSVVGGDIYVAGMRVLSVSHDGGDSWTAVPAPIDGDIFTVAAAGPTGSPLIVSAANTGLFRTGDDGAHYTKVGLTASSVTALVTDRDPTGAPALLAGTTTNAYLSPMPGGQVDADTRDWGTGAADGIGFRVTSMSVDPADPKIVFAAVANAFSRFYVERSTDAGQTWTIVEDVRTSARPHQIVVDPAHPDHIYLSLLDPLSPGLLVSRDGGQTWRKNDLPAPITALAADPQDADHLWLGGPDGLYETHDEGQTVTRLSATPVTALAVDPGNPTRLVVGGDGIFYSRDGGHTLTETTDSPFRLNVAALLIAADGTIYAADDADLDPAGLPIGGRGVLASNNGGRTWHTLSTGLPNRAVASLAVSPDGRWLFAGTEGGGVYRRATGR